MSKTSVKAAITQALQTPKGRPQVSKAEAQAITAAALKETRGAPKVTADEAKLIGQLLQGDSFDGGKTQYQLTAQARQVLEAFAASQHLPIGANADAMKAQVEGVLANTTLGAPLAKAPSTSSLLKLTLSDSRPSDGALREALLNPTTGSFYLRTTSQGRGQTKPTVSYYGPISLAGPVTPPAGKLSAAALGAALARVADGYLFPSETDVPLSYLTGPQVTQVTASGVVAAFAAQHDAQVNSMFGTSSAAKLAGKYVQEVPAADFLSRYSQAFDPNDPASVANARKFSDVAALLQANLTDLHVYRFSEGDPSSNITAPGEVSIFIAGRAASGELVSVMTGSVET